MELFASHIKKCLDAGHPFALAMVTAHRGSTPRTSGTRMVVMQNREICGTVGGGLMEARVIDACMDLIAAGVPGGKIIEFSLDQELKKGLDMVCGGHVTLWLETFLPPFSDALVSLFDETHCRETTGEKAVLISRLNGFVGDTFNGTDKCLLMADGTALGPLMVPKSLMDEILDGKFRGDAPVVSNIGMETFVVEPVVQRDTLYILGAGHVGYMLGQMAPLVDFRTIVVDDRAEFASENRFAHADGVYVVDQFETAFDQVPIVSGAYMVIVTRGHLHDQTVLDAALKADAAYIGMIGSRKKKAQIYANLMGKGVSEAALEKVFSPIGLKIGSETPAEIAVSILAEMIQFRADRK